MTATTTCAVAADEGRVPEAEGGGVAAITGSADGRVPDAEEGGVACLGVLLMMRANESCSRGQGTAEQRAMRKTRSPGCIATRKLCEFQLAIGSRATNPLFHTCSPSPLLHTCSGSLLGLAAAAARLMLPPPMRGGVIIAAAPAGRVAALGAPLRLPPSSPAPKVVLWLRLRGPLPPEEAEAREAFRAESSATGRGPVRLCRLARACGVRAAVTLDLKAAEGAAVGGLVDLVLLALGALGLLLVLLAAAAAEGVDRGWAEARRSAAACSRSRAKPGRVASCRGAGGGGRGEGCVCANQGPVVG